MEPALLSALSKLVALGLTARKAIGTEGIDETEVALLKAGLDSASSILGLRTSSTDITARYLGLTTAAFGEALKIHWAGSPKMVPKKRRGPRWFAKWLEEDTELRRREIEARITFADGSEATPPMDHSTPEEELRLLSRIAGSPLENPVYVALWRAFTNDKLNEPGGTSPLHLSKADSRDFERAFARAWAHALATTAGSVLQRWRQEWAHEQPRLLRRQLTEDLSAWGRRHVFGNVRLQDPADPLPYLPLEDIYVAPPASWSAAGSRDEPEHHDNALKLVSRLVAEHHIVVVKAHFGSGKSLTARMLARDLARTWLEDNSSTQRSRQPVFIKCPRDIRDPTYSHAEVVRNALWAHSEEVTGERLPLRSPRFAPPAVDEPAIFIVDGLDEVSLSPNQTQTLFERLEEETGNGRTAVVFTRPAALHSQTCIPKGSAVITIHEFTDDGIQAWTSRWNECTTDHPVHSENPVRVSQLRARAGLVKLARTPILLLMIALTWSDENAQSANTASLYEGFFQHIARGKFAHDIDEHPPVAGAALSLYLALQDNGHSGFDTEPTQTDTSAMLWLMGLVGWTSIEREQRKPPVPLRGRHIATLIEDELGVDNQVLSEVYLGAMLALQFDPSGAEAEMLFGHQSFRDYLVARHVHGELTRIAKVGRESELGRRLESRLSKVDLFTGDRNSLMMLFEICQNRSSETARIRDWAVRRFRDQRLWGVDLCSDNSHHIRTLALALATELADPGFPIRESSELASLVATWNAKGLSAPLWAPGIFAPGIALPMADLGGANFRGANFSNSHMFGASFTDSDLSECKFEAATLHQTLFWGANLTNSSFVHANLFHTSLCQANCSGVDFRKARLGGVSWFLRDTEQIFGRPLVNGVLIDADSRLGAEQFSDYVDEENKQ